VWFKAGRKIQFGSIISLDQRGESTVVQLDPQFYCRMHDDVDDGRRKLPSGTVNVLSAEECQWLYGVDHLIDARLIQQLHP
jgi:hypothetical protein